MDKADDPGGGGDDGDREHQLLDPASVALWSQAEHGFGGRQGFLLRTASTSGQSSAQMAYGGSSSVTHAYCVFAWSGQRLRVSPPQLTVLFGNAQAVDSRPIAEIRNQENRGS
ncbi:MAG: hypothetical protein IPK78_15325 [Rhodospirillales bacterium]|nr:hypothetical protein [Rhodospirillales bacterium]